MSFIKKLFGGGNADTGEPQPTGETVTHEGFAITATPFSEGGQFQTCGIVSKQIGGSLKEHRFIRADRFAGKEEAAAHAIRKGKQLIDEQGEALFR